MVVGQLLAKLGSKSIHLENFSIFQFFNILIISAFICMFIRGLIWLFIIKQMNLSFAYPFISLSFVLILIISYIFFNERITLGKILGSSLIILGIIFNSLGEKKRKNQHD